MDNKCVIRWFERWPGHQDEPGYGIIFQALRDVRDGVMSEAFEVLVSATEPGTIVDSPRAWKC